MLDVWKLTASLWPEQVSLSSDLNLHLPQAEICEVYFLHVFLGGLKQTLWDERLLSFLV